jgi:hypothetical protein
VTTRSTIVSTRRYYLLKAQAADRDGGFATTWWGKQEAESGTSLPDTFPSRAALIAAHYSTIEDLTGAGTQELVTEAHLTIRQADAVIAAVAAL